MVETPTASLVPFVPSQSLRLPETPALVRAAGHAAEFAWGEWLRGHLRNAHTRTAYRRAVERFLNWAAPLGAALPDVTPALVGEYFDRFDASVPTRKLHLAALRAFFDVLTLRHVVLLNPAASVRGERYQAIEGKTPEITPEQARTLIASIEIGSVIGRRDRAIVATLVYTAARAGAVARLRMQDLRHDSTQYTLRFGEKGGKDRQIPVRHDLQRYLQSYLDGAGLTNAPPQSPLFRTAPGKSGRLTDEAVSAGDIGRIVKRRLRVAGLPLRLSPHSFRVCTVTDLLTQGVPLDEAQTYCLPSSRYPGTWSAPVADQSPASSA